MAKVIDFQEYKEGSRSQKWLSPWNHQFNEKLNRNSSFADLKPFTLLHLASPGEHGTTSFYELINHVISLDNKQKGSLDKSGSAIELIDIHLLLFDTARYETMFRINWLKSYPNQEINLIDLILHFSEHKGKSFTNPPQLSSTHHEYEQYLSMVNREREVMIRKLFLTAYEAYKELIKE